MIPWAALQTNISTEFETGHWEPCTSVTDPGTLTRSDHGRRCDWDRHVLQQVQRPI